MSKVPSKSIAKMLLTNPAVRRLIVRNAKRAVTSASTAIAARTEKKAGSPSGGPAPAPVADSAAVKNLITSVAKPVAEKLAASETGRSLLETVHNISADALGTASKRTESPLNAFVTRLAKSGAAPAAKAEAPRQPESKFTPLQPPPPPAGSQGSVVKWPPPKHATGVSSSDRDTARE